MNEYEINTFGALLKYYRKVRKAGLPIGKKWTQARLADAVNVSVETISLWERNKVCPEESNLLALLDAFGLNPRTVGSNNKDVQLFLDFHQKLREQTFFPINLSLNTKNRLEDSNISFDIKDKNFISSIIIIILLRQFTSPFSSKNVSELSKLLFQSKLLQPISNTFNDLSNLSFFEESNGYLNIVNSSALSGFVSSSVAKNIVLDFEKNGIGTIQFGQYWSDKIAYKVCEIIDSREMAIHLIDNLVQSSSSSQIGEPEFRNSEDLLIRLFSSPKMVNTIIENRVHSDANYYIFENISGDSPYLNKGALIWGWINEYLEMSEVLLKKIMIDHREWSDGFLLLSLSCIMRISPEKFHSIRETIFDRLPTQSKNDRIILLNELTNDISAKDIYINVNNAISELKPSGLSLKGRRNISEEKKWGKFAKFVEYTDELT